MMKQLEDTGLAPGGWAAEQLVAAAQDGDSAALSALLTASHPHVQRFARSLCSSPQDAEDAAQEAMIVLYRQIGTLRATAALSSWMFRIVRNECLRQLRFAMRPTVLAPERAPSAEAMLLSRLETERLVEAISALPDDQRAVLVLRDVQGYSGAATAQALGLSRAAMKSRLHRARQTVRERLRYAQA